MNFITNCYSIEWDSPWKVSYEKSDVQQCLIPVLLVSFLAWYYIHSKESESSTRVSSGTTQNDSYPMEYFQLFCHIGNIASPHDGGPPPAGNQPS